MQTDVYGTTQTYPMGVEEQSRARPSVSDLWRWEGLGKAKARVYALLDDEGRWPTELAKALGVEPRTVSRHLASLASFDLAERTDQGWIAGSADPAEIAEQVGVAGRGAFQRQWHAAQRQQRAQYLDRRVRDRKDDGTPTEEIVEMIDMQASEETARGLMAWVTLRARFSRDYIEQMAGRHGEQGLYDLARDLIEVPA